MIAAFLTRMRIDRHNPAHLLATLVLGTLLGCTSEVADDPAPCAEASVREGSPCGQGEGELCVSAGAACDERLMECRSGRFEAMECLGPQPSACARWELCEGGEGPYLPDRSTPAGEGFAPAVLRAYGMELPLALGGEEGEAELSVTGTVERVEALVAPVDCGAASVDCRRETRLVLRDDAGDPVELDLALPLSAASWATTGRSVHVRYVAEGSFFDAREVAIEVTDATTDRPLLHAVHSASVSPEPLFGVALEREPECLFPFVQPSAITVYARTALVVGDTTLAPSESVEVTTSEDTRATVTFWYGQHRPGWDEPDAWCWEESAIGAPEPLAWVITAAEEGTP